MKTSAKHPLRTRFAKDIVCEFLPSTKKSHKVLILCTGMPGYPGGTGKAIRAFSEKGYWVFVPRYRGTWESSGNFLADSPHQDILDVVKGVTKPFVDLYSGKTMRVSKPQIFILGASFGGAAALLASCDVRVRKAVALSPVTDWTMQEKSTEPVNVMAAFLPKAFGEGYRGHENSWHKLKSGRFFNPAHEAKTMDGKKIFIIHAKDDEVVPFAPSQAFAKEIGAAFHPLRRGGHFGVSSALKPHLFKRIEKFLK